jgi:hypothetical protein
MAGTVQRLIRHLWGFLLNPADIENKQQSFNEGDNGAGRDRTQLVAKGPTGTSHTWITIDEIEDYVQNELSSFSSISGVYVKVATPQDLLTTLGFDGSFTIYCDDNTGSGLVLSDELDTSVGTGHKTIIGAGEVALYMSNEDGLFNLDIPVDSSVSILNKIVVDTSVSPFAMYITCEGSGTMRISEIQATDTIGDFRVGYKIISSASCLIERNITPDVLANDISTGLTYQLWSGRHDELRLDEDTVKTVCREHRISSEGANTLDSEIVEFLGSPTTSSPLHYRNYNYSLNTLPYAQEQHSAKTIDILSQARSTFTKSLIGTNGLLNPILKLNGNTQGSITKRNDPWDEVYTVLQVGNTTLFSYEDGAKIITGVAENCYNDGFWRFRFKCTCN